MVSTPPPTARAPTLTLFHPNISDRETRESGLELAAILRSVQTCRIVSSFLSFDSANTATAYHVSMACYAVSAVVQSSTTILTIATSMPRIPWATTVCRCSGYTWRINISFSGPVTHSFARTVSGVERHFQDVGRPVSGSVHLD